MFFMGFMFFPWCNFVSRMDKYSERFGSMYDHVDHKRLSPRLVPFLFILKRVMFASGAWFVKTELPLIFALIELVNIILIIVAEPYLDKSLNNVELFNASIAYTFFLFLQVFRGTLMDLESQYKYGWVSSAIYTFFIVVHLIRNLPKCKWLKEKYKAYKLKKD